MALCLVTLLPLGAQSKDWRPRKQLERENAQLRERIEHLQEEIERYRSEQSEKQRLQQEVSLANQLYSQLSQQAEMAKAKIQEIKPMYAVIQPSTMPRYPLNSRKKTVIIWGFAGFLLGCLWAAFGLDAFRKARKGVKAKLKEK